MENVQTIEYGQNMKQKTFVGLARIVYLVTCKQFGFNVSPDHFKKVFVSDF